MNTEMKLTETRVELIRTFDAPRAVVFDAWVDPEKAKHWSGCAGSTIESMTVDLRVGGQSRTAMLIQGAGPMTAVGTYTEVDPPKRLAYELGWEAEMGMEIPVTLVTVDFEALGDRTRVRLVQEGLMSPEMEASLSQNWSGSLDRFGTTLPMLETEVVA